MKVCYFTHASNVTGANRSLLDMLAGLRGTDVEPVVIIRGKADGKVSFIHASFNTPVRRIGYPHKSESFTSVHKRTYCLPVDLYMYV